MDLLTQLNCAMAYIEENIQNNIMLTNVSSVTMYSEYHFGRLFYYIAEMPLSEYIRKRKLSLAAMDLQNKKEKVIDIALKYGYESADSFTRAFVKQHNVTPTASRKTGTELKIYSPLSFQIKIKGVQGMNWRIEQREAFEVFGIERAFKNDESQKIPAFWSELHQNGSYEKLLSDSGGNRKQNGDIIPNDFLTTNACIVNALCGHIDESKGDSFNYMLFAVKTENSNTEGYKVAQVPKATWVVFRESGMENHENCKIPDLFKKAYSEWLPSSGYDKASGFDAAPDIEVYGKDFEEVWIPVIKK